LTHDGLVRMGIRTIASLVTVLLPAVCLAGGSVSLGEVDPLLRQAPAIRDFLLSSLELDDTAMAAVRFGSHLPHLGGARMGPYMIRARPKASKDTSPLELVLCTDVRFFDEAGHVVEDETRAARLEEKLSAVMIREMGSLPPIPNCPTK